MKALDYINKEFILKRVTQKEIFEKLLPLTVGSSLIKSPFREDKKAGCSFYYTQSNVLIFKDWAKEEVYDCFSAVQKYYSLPTKKLVYEKIYNELIKSNSNIELKEAFLEKNDYSIIIGEWTEQYLKYWITKYKITKKILETFNVFPVKKVFKNGKLLRIWKDNYPIFGFLVPGLDKFKLYFPYNSSKWISLIPKQIVLYSWNLKKKSVITIISKATKDAMCLYKMGFKNVIVPSSETTLIGKEYLNSIKARYKIVFFDNDEAGKKAAEKYKKMEFLTIEIPEYYKVKDISDFEEKYGSKKAKKLVQKLIKKCLI